MRCTNGGARSPRWQADRKGKLAEQGLRRLRPSVHVAQGVGADMGPGALLLAALPPCAFGTRGNGLTKRNDR